MSENFAEPQFREFVAASLPSFLRFGYILTGSPLDSEDLVEEALVRTGVAWGRIRRHDRRAAYVRKVMVRLYLNKRRALRREVLQGSPIDRGSVPAEYSTVEERSVLAQALTGLPPGQRVIVVLRYYLDMSNAEVAEYLGCSVGNVKSQASRALDRLREQMPGEDVNTPRRDNV
jgi:RNA polymerase sigma-70 factor (sigma-E family)